MTTIGELARTVRSKNSNPYQITVDIIFDAVTEYETVKQSEEFVAEEIAEHYNIEVDDVKGIFYYDEVYAIKIGIRRPVTAGDIGDGDVYGAQQYVPILDMEVS